MAGPSPTTSPSDPGNVAPVALRPDLVRREQPYLGRRFIVFKNPLSLGYFRLPLAHAQAADRFDGKTTLREIVAALRTESPYWSGMPEENALAELGALAHQLGAAGLLRVRAPSAVERARRLREVKRKHRFEMAVGQTLFFKKSLVDPDRFLERTMPAVAWVFQPTILIGAVLFMLSAVFVAVENWGPITAHGANFFTLQNLGLTWILFIFVKILHEFGHAYTCKRFGGEVHEMGFMFILFTPYLFCNVTDSWLAQRRARIAVTAAGIFVELFIAAAATWLWLFSQPGLFKQMCFNTMVLCSVSTILFNANPLMKFDGYYIMTDILEIPNLRAKSNAWVTHWAQRTLLGMKSAGAKIASHEIGPAFGFYAVAAYCYGWFIMWSISVHLFNMLEPYGLEVISRTYVALFLFVSLGLPIYRLGRTLKGSNEFRERGIPRLRFALVIAAGVVGVLFLIPWQETIRRSAALEHAQVETVASPAPGFLREVLVEEGQNVSEGELLGRLKNVELESTLTDLKLQREVALVRHRAALGDPSPEARLSIAALERFVAEADEQIRATEDKVARLELRAAMDGVVRTKRPQDLVGRHFTAGQPVFELGRSGPPKLIIALNEKQARKVAVGQTVDVRFQALPERSFPATISSVPVAPGDRLTVPSFANLYGGDVPADPGADGQPHPSLPHFEAEAVISLPPEFQSVLRAQSLGTAKIHVRSTSAGRWLSDRALDLIDPNMRL